MRGLSRLLSPRYDSGYTFAVKTAISIPDEVYRAAERVARKLGVSRSRLYADAIREFVSRAEERNITEKLNQVYEKSPTSPDPLLLRMQWASLGREEW
jgi:predicted nuclease with RNAse H fold